jgi:pimeloyl-ACP methyl ester carboxylesterase
MDTGHDCTTRLTARVSRRDVLTAGALGVAAGLTAAIRASAHPFPTMNRTNEEETMTALSTTLTQLPTPVGPGSVSGAPNLPAGFTDTFTSRYVDTGAVRLHAVIGGDGPPLLLVHGWPQLWYQWRLVMPTLARDFTVVAIDQRGIGLSDKPRDGYDTGTQANDMVALMEALGHTRFAMVGFDTGMPISYALAADHPERLDRLVVGEAVISGVTPSPPLIGSAKANDQFWHLTFNRLTVLNEQLVRGREDLYFGFQFDKGGRKLPDDAINYYITTIATDPDNLRGSFAQYRAFDETIAQNQQRMTQRLTLPVLAIGGGNGIGEAVGSTMKLVADDVQSVIIPDTGHWVAEEAPEKLLSALTAFLAPYRDGQAAGESDRHPDRG